MAYSIYEQALKLFSNNQVRLVNITDRKYTFETWSQTLEDWVSQIYDRRTCRFKPCGSPHGKNNPLGSWISEIAGHDCRHTLACKMLMDENNMPYKNMSDDIMVRRNDVLRLLERSCKKNKIVKGHNEGSIHHQEKELLAKRDEEQDRWFVQEARFKNGGRADHLTLDTATVVEILVSEKMDDAVKKLEVYPKELTIVFRKDGEEHTIRKGSLGYDET